MCGVLSTFAQGTQLDHQKAADSAKFEWSKEQASILYSLSQYSGSDEIHLIYDPKWRSGRPVPLTIRIVRGGKVIFSQRGHEATVFKVVANIIYYADFLPGASGCAVVAYDLKKQKRLWRNNLQGVGPVYHSKYFNSVTLNADDNVVVVHGHEMVGDYVEYVDMKSGKTVGHRVFRRGYTPE